MECIKITLSSSDYANGVHMDIQNKFFEVFKISKAPKNMMMLSLKDHPIDGKPIFLLPHDNPLIVALSRLFQSEISTLPNISELSHLSGHADAIDILASS